MRDRMTLRRLKREHFGAIDLGERFAVFGRAQSDPEMAERLAACPGLAAFSGDTLVAIGGLVFVQGRCFIWMAGGKALRPRHYLVLGTAATRLAAHGHAIGYTRVEAHVRCGWPAAARWIRRLGFVRAASAGEEFDVYVHCAGAGVP